MNATETITNPTATVVAPRTGRLFWGGLLLVVASLAAYVLQVAWAHMLFTPWYLPIAGSIGSLLMLAALVRRWRWWQLPLLLVMVALAAFEWWFLAMSVLPGYSGPVAIGSPLPAFHARLADGTQIDNAFLTGRGPTAVVFFQGRWCPFCMTHLTELETHHDALDQKGARVLVVSIEDVETAAETQRDFPHLVVVSDADRELADAVDLINPHFAPNGDDAATPTFVILDDAGLVRWVHRPTRFIERPSAAELARHVEGK